MKTRIITGTVYTVVLVSFYLLKIFVHDLCFDALLYAFALIGTFEFLRATKEKTTKAQRVLSYAFAIAFLPCFALTGNIAIGSALTLGFIVGTMSLLVLDYQNTTLESVGISLVSFVYPNLLLGLLSWVNHIPGMVQLQNFAFNSDLLVLFIFTISPVSDAVAYFFGVSMRKRFPRKFCPSISPNKTAIGALGGLVGGLVGAGLVYVVYNATLGNFDSVALWLPVYLVTGVLGAVATAFGDLLESAIKRKIGVKDMGNIMPGHGGVLDRIDGTMFACVAVCLVFVVLSAILL